VIYSASHGGSQNPLVVEAKARGIQTLHQAQFIGELLKNFRHTIAVAGSHGKTTTSALLAFALIKLGLKPTYLIGSSDFNNYPAGDFNSFDYFVVEADEYAVDPPRDKTPKFNFLHPEIILCTNIDFDHPDVFKDLNDVKRAFINFFKQTNKIINCDNLRVENVKVDENGTSFIFRGEEFNLSLYGEKNALNAAGAISVLLELGIEIEKIKAAIKDFTGAKRRFELKFFANDTYLFDDYGHHPKEIEATIQATRERFPGRRILVIFQPHTYSRTQSLLNDFSVALTKADLAYIMPIFSSARENPQDFNITAHDIAQNDSQKAVDSPLELFSLLKANVKRGDIIFTMGAGDVYKLENDIINLIRKL
jgi:UDP-N-acetylmuramate--alanine ligase